MRDFGDSCEIWLSMGDDGECLTIELENRPLFFNVDDDKQDHWLQYCLAHEPFSVWFGLNDAGRYSKSVQQWALENGIAPGQRFMVKLDYWHSYDPFSGEHDEGIEHEIIKIEPWTDDQILGAWCAWWMSYIYHPCGDGSFPK